MMDELDGLKEAALCGLYISAPMILYSLWTVVKATWKEIRRKFNL